MKKKHCKMLSVLAFLLAVTPFVAMAQQTDAQEPGDQLDLIYRTLDVQDWNGSVYTVKAEDFLNSSTLFLTEDLMGIIPGMVMRQSEGGLENANASYWIRGTRSLNNGVLVLIDGVERAFASLTPEEVESISVLKDAAAVGIYGMKAANGALLITTKKGSVGEPKVSFSAQLMNQAPTALYSPLDAYGYAKHYNAAQRSDGTAPKYSEFDLANYAAGSDPLNYPDVHWLDKYYKNGWLNQRYNVTVTGGLKNATYFVDFGYLHQPSMINTDNDLGYNTGNNADRYNYRSNISVDVTETTHLNVDLYGWFKKQNDPYTDTGNVYSLLNTTPALAFPEYYMWEEGMIDQDSNEITGVGGKLAAGNTQFTNPWTQLNRRGYSRVMQMYGSLGAELSQRLDFIVKGLSARAKIALDSQTNSTIQRTRGSAYYTPEGGMVWHKTGNEGNLSNTVESKSGNRKLTIDAGLYYANSFGKNNFSGCAFYEQYEDSADSGVPGRFQSVNGYASWNYDHRFGIDVTGSYYGWIGFAPGHKFGFFPTIAAGWTLSNEEFLKGSDFVSYLKLRGSYGKLGSFRGVERFTYLGYMSSESAVYVNGNQMGNSRAGYYEGQIANTGLTWENVYQMNLGLDARLFSNRLSFMGEFWTDKRDNAYTANNKVSTLIGLNGNVSVSSNIGATDAWGFDLGLQWKDKIGDWSYQIGGTYTFWRTIVKANGAVDEQYDYISALNYPISRKLSYQVEGIFQSYDEIAASANQSNWSQVMPGDYKFRDVNGDGIINTNDRVPVGYSNVPEIFYGFNFGLGWKNLSLMVLFQGAANVSHNMDEVSLQPFYSNGNIYEHQLDYWTPENPGAKYCRTGIANTSTANNSVAGNSIVDASYLRLKRVELAYKFSENLFKGNFVKGATIFASGYDLFTWTPYEYGDPEYVVTVANLPITRNISLGCRLNF